MTALLFAATWVAACGDQVTEPGPDGPAIRPAAGGNGNGKGGGGNGDDPVVDEVEPPGAEQGASLRVTVRGANFDASAQVGWLLNKKPTTDIRTDETFFIDDTTLEADITIDAAAQIDLFDVEVVVTAAGGPKRGVGVEKFAVLAQVSLTGMFQTVSPQNVEFQDTGKLLHIRHQNEPRQVLVEYGHVLPSSGALNFADCVTENGLTTGQIAGLWDRFAAEFDDPSEPDPPPSGPPLKRLFRVQMDKKSVQAGRPDLENLVFGTWFTSRDGPEKRFLFKIGTDRFLLGTNVNATTREIAPDVFEYTGGAVIFGEACVSGNCKSVPVLGTVACPNDPARGFGLATTVTLIRAP